MGGAFGSVPYLPPMLHAARKSKTTTLPFRLYHSAHSHLPYAMLTDQKERMATALNTSKLFSPPAHRCRVENLKAEGYCFSRFRRQLSISDRFDKHRVIGA